MAKYAVSCTSMLSLSKTLKNASASLLESAALTLSFALTL